MTLHLICPICRTKFVSISSDMFNCSACKRVFKTVAGIPDFRTLDPPYITREKEKERIDLLMTCFDRSSWEELVRFYVYEVQDHATETLRRSDLEHRLRLRQRALERMRAYMDMLKKLGREFERDKIVLDLGCGSGESMVGFLQSGHKTVGIDISYEELLLGKKLCFEEGFDSVLLLAGNAEALPFQHRTFDFIYSMDVIEHVKNQSKFVNESQRVLRNEGSMLFNSPNRFSLLAPEPHVSLWGMGFLPRVLMDPYCRLKGRGRYIGKRLLSYRELKKKVRKVFPDVYIFKREPNPKSTSFAGKIYYLLTPLSVWIYSLFCEIHTIFAKK